MQNKLAPIVFFCYKRADKTKIVLEQLARNHLAGESELFIFADGPRNEDEVEAIQEVREVIHNLKGFKKIHIEERELNRGLAKSVILGVTKIINEYGKVIVVEDDVFTSVHFLEFMNQALDFYENDEEIFIINAHKEKPVNIPRDYKEGVFFIPGRFDPWGWAIWKDRWDKIDFSEKVYKEFSDNKKIQEKFAENGIDLTNCMMNQIQGKADSWHIRACYSQFKSGGFSVVPCKSSVANIGLDGTGIHWRGEFDEKVYQNTDVVNTPTPKLKTFEITKENQLIIKKYINYHSDYDYAKYDIFDRLKKLFRKIKYLVTGMIVGVFLSELTHFIW